jgi:5-methylcytosine-specific restriction enzyme subunit McrC
MKLVGCSVKIPIKNLFYLLAYAWDVLESGDVTEVGAVDGTMLEDLVASVLVMRMERLLRRGLEQDYQEKREDSTCIRGRIDFQETTKRMLRRQGRAHVISDELSPDTLANRILKATVGTLLRFKTLDDTNREKLALLYRGLREVADVRISESSFCRVRLHRNNQEYRLLISICEMVQRYVLPEQQGTGFRFIEFEEKEMGRLFQVFLTRFYEKRQRAYKVDSPRFDWCVSQSPAVEGFSIPQLQTDMVLSTSSSQLVVDAKFYKQPFDCRFGRLTVQSEHLNQMFAYMQNIASRDQYNRRVDGIILYAAVTGPFQQDWKLFGHSLRVAGVDLHEDWHNIDKQLLSIIGIGAEPSPPRP